MLSFYEFFSGGGMARVGLGPNWRCLFANDNDPKKVASYRRVFGAQHRLVGCDVESLTTSMLPGRADLAWASFPCQDLSLAGNGAGLSGHRSGTFWPFWRLIQQLRKQRRSPRAIVLENVYGAVTSHNGKDLAAIADALVEGGYRFGLLIIDAVHFVPQSRPRLFIVAIDHRISIPPVMFAAGPTLPWHPEKFALAYARVSDVTRKNWVWWNLPAPSQRVLKLSDLIEDQPVGIRWHTPQETARLIGMMSPINQRKVQQAKRGRGRTVGTLYRRTRPGPDGVKRQRAEVRFDGISGCLRTPVGGSSRQTILVVEGQTVRSRLLSPREAARLMGVPDSYPVPENYNEAYHLFGDGLVVPVVSYIERHLIRPLVGESQIAKAA